MDQIILNGKIALCSTGDDNDSTVGIRSYMPMKTFAGKRVVSSWQEFPLTKAMAEKCEWPSKFASVQFVIADKPINDPEKAMENVIRTYMGDVEADYSHHYSDLTGYLWTDEEFVVGGHDLREILSDNYDKFIHLEIELYSLNEVPPEMRVFAKLKNST